MSNTYLKKLIETCASCNVKSIKINGENVDVEFFGEQNQVQQEILPVLTEEANRELDIDEKFKKVSVAEGIDRDFDTLPVSDPEKFEEMLSNEKIIEFGEEAYAET